MASQFLAQKIRESAVRMVSQARASHVAGALSMADILAVLYHDTLQIRPEEPDFHARDRVILSKGHSCTGLYATLAHTGFFPVEELLTYGKDGSRLMSHISHKVPGVDFSTGSLGHGLPFGCGKALAAKRRKAAWRTFVILSDGEMNEGSNWEAVLFAPQHALDNLIAIVDYNKIQSLGRVKDVLDLDPFAEKFSAFRWAVKEVDGHDHDQLREVLSSVPWEKGRPSVVVAHTVKGKGVSYMENDLAWHYKSPTPQQERQAVLEIWNRENRIH